jgi:hypothetical protein
MSNAREYAIQWARDLFQNEDPTYLRDYPGTRVDVLDILASGERVVIVFLWSGTHGVTIAGVPATGRKFAISGFQTFFVPGPEGASPFGSPPFLDTLTFLWQVGARQPPPNVDPFFMTHELQTFYQRVSDTYGNAQQRTGEQVFGPKVSGRQPQPASPSLPSAKRREPRRCPVCGGNGTQRIYTPSASNQANITQSMPCARCQGSGRILPG